MRKHTWIFLAAGLKSALIAAALMSSACSSGLSGDELKASIELVDVETQWEKKYYQPWPPKLILVPAISFRIKNVGDKPLDYIYCNAIFRQSDEKENLGDNFVAGIRGKKVMPGETSDVITMQSYLGYDGKNLAHFKNNPAWKTVLARVFVKSKGSQYVQVGEYEVSKKINFTEPEDVKPPEEETPDKKAPVD
jgi:hypothetical protein